MDEVCPNCGNFIEELDDDTGWCRDCTLQVKDTSTAPSRCKRCTKIVPSYHQFCRRCKKLNLLEEAADDIEQIMAINGMDVIAAISAVSFSNKTYCLVCGDTLPQQKSRRIHICKSRRECTLAHHRVRYLIYEKNYTIEKALEEVIGVYAS